MSKTTTCPGHAWEGGRLVPTVDPAGAEMDNSLDIVEDVILDAGGRPTPRHLAMLSAEVERRVEQELDDAIWQALRAILDRLPPTIPYTALRRVLLREDGRSRRAAARELRCSDLALLKAERAVERAMEVSTTRIGRR